MTYLVLCERKRGIWWPVGFSLTQSFPAFQRHNGDILTTASVKHLSHRRFVVSFQLDSVQRTDQDLYRCVTQSPRGSGVSNFAELVVKGKCYPSLSFIFGSGCFTPRHELSCCFRDFYDSEVFFCSSVIQWCITNKQMLASCGKHVIFTWWWKSCTPILNWFLQNPLITVWMALDTYQGSLDGGYHLLDMCCFLS